MTLENYLLFVGASILLCIVPGPDMVFLLTRCVAQGTKAGLMAAFGFNLGAYVHLTAAALGLSAILAASSFAFTVVKFVGACYLFYLGIRALISHSGPLSLNPNGLTKDCGRAIFWQGFTSDVLNPKVAMFFIALLPQFVDAHGHHPTMQLLLLGATVNVIAITINICLVMVSARVTRVLRQNSTIAGWLHKAMGVVFVAFGPATGDRETLVRQEFT
jgi:threonine/homoserine/homoserine lactone efflux protein